MAGLADTVTPTDRGDMKRALVRLVLLSVAACTLTGREVITTVDGVPVTVVSGRQTCIEVGDDDAGSGSWCGPDEMPEAVWLGAASAGQQVVVAGQAPDEVALPCDCVGKKSQAAGTLRAWGEDDRWAAGHRAWSPVPTMLMGG